MWPEILNLFTEPSRKNLSYGPQVLYAALTGVYIDLTDVHYNVDIPQRLSLVSTWDRVMLTKLALCLPKCPQEDESFDESPPFLTALVPGWYGLMEEIVVRYKIISPETYLPELQMFPPGVDRLVVSYLAPMDNVSELAQHIGMTFPPRIKTDLQKTRYFFQNLSGYLTRDKKHLLEEYSVPLENLPWYILINFRDEVLLEYFGPFDDWDGHRDLVDRIIERKKIQKSSLFQ